MSTEILDDRFWAKVDKNGPVMPGMTTACWIWTGYRDRKGYGRISRSSNGKSRPLRTSRIALEDRLGRALGVKMQACHFCDNPPCIRGDHLFEGTNQENQLDSVSKGRRPAPTAEAFLPGEKHNSAKLTEASVTEIRRRYADGGSGIRGQRGAVTMRQLANEYGLGIGPIHAVISGRTWRHVGGPTNG